MVPGEQQLGRYRLLKLIATGGMGEIHLAEDVSIDRQVAIKVMRSEGALYSGESSSSDAARLFEREAKAIAMLDHPHILPLYDYGEEKKDGTVLTYLVMPYRPEGSLANWLEQRGPTNPLALEDVESIVTQTASALQYTHDHQIVHQDVKPSNFLIRVNRDNPNRPDILVSDFGIARLSNTTSDASQSIRGTPGYMSPEQWEGKALPASDQYALAVMTYELIAGRAPFKGNPMQMMFAHVNTPPQPPSSIVPSLPSALDAVILRGLAKKPEDRFPSISAFAQAFQQAVRGSAVSPLPLTNPYASASAPITAAGGSLSGAPERADVIATLAISEIEAARGSERVLTLSDGTRIPVSIPPGVRDSQILEINRAGSTLGGAGVLRLQLSVRPVPQGEIGPTIMSRRPLATNDALTYVGDAYTSPAPTNNNPTAATRWQGGGIAPSPTPGQTLSSYAAQSTYQYANTAPPQQLPGQFSTYANAPVYPGVAVPPPRGPLPSSSPSQPPYRPRQTSRGLFVVLIILALILVLGGGGLVYAMRGGTFTGSGSGTPGITATSSTMSNIYATQTAQANAGQYAQSTATAQVNASATANTQVTAGVQATATAQASATAQVQANATATASVTNPYGGTLVLSDPLIDNSRGYNWTVSSDTTVGTSCQFTNNAYHMIMPGNYGGPCIGQATNFSNFAFQVQMTFFQYGKHFSGGGLVFRSTGGSQYYVLQIYESGLYSFSSCNGNDCSHGIAGYPASSVPISSFRQGLNQTNTIAVVAQNNTFTFYANGQQFAGPITDGTYSSGALGFYAEGGSEGGAGATVDVAYTNAKVWQL